MVAAARTDGGAAHVIREELSDGLNPNVKLVGSGVEKRAVDVVDGWHGGGWIGLIVSFMLGGSSLTLGGADALAGLDEVDFDGFGARGIVLGGISEG